MDQFYFFTILVALTATLSKKISFFLLCVGVFVALILLPDTGYDYIRYQTTFEGGYSINTFPFFKTRATIDAEPLYLWYNGLMSVLLEKNFQLFLAINFLICLLISRFTFRKLPLEYFILFWMFLLPVIIPTIFYFSPRSSISFFFILTGFSLLSRQKFAFSALAILAGISIHSQFILISFLMLLTYMFVKYRFHLDLKRSKNFILLISLMLIIGLTFVNRFSGVLESILTLLPSADIATAKLHYLENAREGIRVTALLSIFFYPLFAFLLLNKKMENQLFIFNSTKLDNMFMILLFAVVCYGASVNIAFFDSPHLAGRLSRFSDYIGMGLLLPLFLLHFFRGKILLPALIFLILISPFIFSTLYHNVEWGMF